MARTVQKDLSFPLSGVVRRAGYREQTRPYSSPWAVNVRGVDSIECRERGGSRPGLVKVSVSKFDGGITAMVPVSSVNQSGSIDRDIVIIAGGYFYRLNGGVYSTQNGAISIGGSVITIGGEEVVFPSSVSSESAVGPTSAYSAAERCGKLYLADTVLREYDPQTGIVSAVIPSSGIVPTGQPVICMYRDRIILTGECNMWYASRQGNVSDWNFGADMSDAGRAVAGQLARAGGIGHVPMAAIPISDKFLVFACKNSLWAIWGDPATDRMDMVSGEIGIVAENAWAVSGDGMMAFLSNDGIYVWQAGSGSSPVRFSEGRIPSQLRNVDAEENIISMAYDQGGRGFHLFITPVSGDCGCHWWIDIANKAMWPVHLDEDHQPVSISRSEESGLAETVIGCSDGYIRRFSENAVTDDGVAIESHVVIGPIQMSSRDTEDSILSEIHGVMADFVGAVEFRIFSGSSAESVADIASEAVHDLIESDACSGCSFRGEWSGGRNGVVRPRVRGAWFAILISSSTVWAYESIAVVANQLGRLRV